MRGYIDTGLVELVFLEMEFISQYVSLTTVGPLTRENRPEKVEENDSKKNKKQS